MFKLISGNFAPNFVTTDVMGVEVRLSSYKNKKLMICFFRYAGCVWCNMAFHRLILEYPRMHNEGLEIITFVQSKPANIKKYIIDKHTPTPPFPIIADPKRIIYDQYGVSDSLAAGVKTLRKIPDILWGVVGTKHHQGKIDGSLGLVPAQFLITADQKIYKANYGVNYFDHISMIDVLEFAQFGAV